MKEPNRKIEGRNVERRSDVKVSRGMIYKWIDDGKFSSVKIGNISRVKRDEFEVWLKEREREGN